MKPAPLWRRRRLRTSALSTRPWGMRLGRCRGRSTAGFRWRTVPAGGMLGTGHPLSEGRPMPRVRLRTLMIAVAAVAVLSWAGLMARRRAAYSVLADQHAAERALLEAAASL